MIQLCQWLHLSCANASLACRIETRASALTAQGEPVSWPPSNPAAARASRFIVARPSEWKLKTLGRIQRRSVAARTIVKASAMARRPDVTLAVACLSIKIPLEVEAWESSPRCPRS
jgi:hypothetical protein